MSRPSAVEADFGEAQQTIDWLMGDEALRTAKRMLRGAGLDPQLAEDLVHGAIASMIGWSRGPSALTIENPAAYGVTVLDSQLNGLLRGSWAFDGELDETMPAAEMPLPVDDGDAADPLRVAIEHQPVPTWLRSASLSYLTLLGDETMRLDGAPSPQAGSTPMQARCWPALYLAGRGDLFDGVSTPKVRRRRARYINQVLELIQTVFLDAAGRGEIENG